FDKAFDVKFDGLANVFDAFFDRLALRVASRQSGTENVVAPSASFSKITVNRWAIASLRSSHSSRFQGAPLFLYPTASLRGLQGWGCLSLASCSSFSPPIPYGSGIRGPACYRRAVEAGRFPDPRK